MGRVFGVGEPVRLAAPKPGCHDSGDVEQGDRAGGVGGSGRWVQGFMDGGVGDGEGGFKGSWIQGLEGPFGTGAAANQKLSHAIFRRKGSR